MTIAPNTREDQPQRVAGGVSKWKGGQEARMAARVKTWPPGAAQPGNVRSEQASHKRDGTGFVGGHGIRRAE